MFHPSLEIFNHTMTTLDDNPIKQALLKAIRKGNAQKLKDILKANPTVSANETLDSAENRLLHKAARYVYTYVTFYYFLSNMIVLFVVLICHVFY